MVFVHIKNMRTFTIHYVNKCHALKFMFLRVFGLEIHGFLNKTLEN